MKNNKGQALIEFIFILPILFLVITCIFDIGNILYKKYLLQNELDYLSDIFLNDGEINAKIYAQEKKINLSIEMKDDFFDIKVESLLKLSTPGLERLLGNPYKIKEQKIVYKESTSDVNSNNLNDSQNYIQQEKEDKNDES